MTNTSDWVRPKEAAKMLGVCTATVRNRVNDGTIPAEHVAPRSVPGAVILIRRTYLTGTVASNITALPQRLTPDDIQRIADAAADAVIARLFPAMARAS